MTIHRNCCAALGAAAWLALSAATANAAPAYVKSTVNLRSGPATTNDIVGKIPGGSLVEANNCAEWCEVDLAGQERLRHQVRARHQRPRSGRAPRRARHTDGGAVR